MEPTTTNKIPILFEQSDTGHTGILFFFYPNGVWDEDKLTLEEAYKKYPRDKYQWFEYDDE